MRFVPGDLIARRYLVLRFIARGGMGEVYEVQDRELGIRIALKCIAVERAGRSNAVERLRREMMLARNIHHEGVCRVRDLGVHFQGDEVVDFLTMDFIEGDTLASWLATRPPLSPGEALSLVAPIASALDAIHARGIVHRDFKPRNIMLRSGTAGGLEPVVMDFGIAVGENNDSRDFETSGGVLVGSPAYMAPEQVAGERVTARSDVYAFGIVLFEMMTGVLPFSGDSPAQTATRRLLEAPPAARSLRRDLPSGWNRVITRCLARRPSDRYASAGAAVRALEAARSGPSLRRRILSAIVLLLLIALVAAAFLFWKWK
jgi:serine/threonine protein kinase